jgi:Sugar-transfer associated ATP-grasp
MMGFLSETAAAGKFDLAAAVQDLVAKGGPGGYRQMFDLLRLRFGRSGARFEEYYTYALWRADRGRAFLREFLPYAHTLAFNSALEMPSRGLAVEIIADKIATEGILAARGLPVTRTRALYAPGIAPGTQAAPGTSHIRLLHDGPALRDFLSDPHPLPVFGKPRTGFFAQGAAAIAASTANGLAVRFMNGVTAPTAGLAEEIVVDWAEGYMFQPFYRSHADLCRHVGPAMASVRIVTLLTDRGIEPWYGVIRVPAKSAMHDGDAFDTRVWGLIDLASGKILKLRNLRDPMSPDITHWMDQETPFAGFTLPHWHEALAAVVAGHESFPGHGILGWDVFLTDEGALLNEANTNPGHVYQVAAGRGMRNPDMAPLYARALAHARAVNERAAS